MFIHKWERNYTGTSYDVHLFVARDRDTASLVGQLLKDGNSYLFMYEDRLPALFSTIIPLKLDASRFVKKP